MSVNDNKQEPQKPGKAPKFGYWIYLLLLGAILVPALFNRSTGAAEIPWTTFDREILKRHAVDHIEVVNRETADIYIRDSLKNDPYFKKVLQPTPGGSTAAGPHYRITIGSPEVFEQKLSAAEEKYGLEPISVSYITRQNWWGQILAWTLPFLLLFFLWQFVFRRTAGNTGAGSAFNFGRSTATLIEKGAKSSVTFDDVAGLEEAKTEVKEIVDFLKDPEVYTRLGAKIPKGMIIVGPPGTGKTLLVKAVAGEAQVPFFSISGSEFVEMFVGVGASRVRDLFRRAKDRAPSIIFIDEIDAVGRSRARNAMYTGANDERESTLNQLLTEMDGFGTNTGVIVLAATNRADMLDPALLRPGRFDRHIYLELPSLTERKAIFQVHMRPLIMDKRVSPENLAAQTPGFSGADIANICNEAALIAARRKKSAIEPIDFSDAIDRVVAGLERKSKIISPKEKQIIAFHEAGHAVVSWLLPGVDSLSKVSIIPRGKSLGASWYLPEERSLRTKSEYTDRLSATLGGRAAEAITFGEVSSGALDDLEKVTKEAYMMVTYYGFNETIGNVSFYDSTGANEQMFGKPYSEATAHLIDEEVRKLVDTAFRRAIAILTENREKLNRIAGLLLKKEVLYQEDLKPILGERNRNKEEVVTERSKPQKMAQQEVLADHDAGKPAAISPSSSE